MRARPTHFMVVGWVGILLFSATAIGDPAGKKVFPWDNPFGVVCFWPEVGQIGAGWCRCGGGATQLGDWASIQPERGKFNWEPAEAEYKNQIMSEKLTMAPLLCYTAPWASSGLKGDVRYPPTDLLDYFRFVKATAERFKGRIPAYEIWNEPNGRGTFFAGGCDQLMLLVKAGYCAIKQADPEAKVIFPGLAGTDVPFAARCYELGASDYFDIMACHPYQWAKVFDEGFFSTEAITNLRNLMDQCGDKSKPIWLNEFGWQVGGEITPDDQARLLSIAVIYYRSLEYLGVERMFWYTTKGWPGISYGLIDINGQKTPAFEAYRTIVANLLNKHYLGRLDAGAARAFVFGSANSQEPVTVAVWSPSLEEIAVALPMKDEAPMKLTAKPMPQFITVARNKLGPLQEERPILPRPGPAVNENVEKMVWTQIVVPDDTHLAYLNRGANELKIHIVNCSDQPQKGTIRLTSSSAGFVRQVKYDLAAEQSTIAAVPVTIKNSVKFGMYPIRITGTAGDKRIAGYEDRIRISPGKTIEFLGNSWIESLYLGKEGVANGGASVSFGDSWTYRFDLTGCKQARLTMDVGANGGKEWNVEVSSDGVKYEVLRSGASWPSHQVIPIPDRYLNGPLWARIRGENCMLYYCVLDMARDVEKKYSDSEWK